VSTQLSSFTLTWTALGLFISFLAVAAVDGVYFHFRRFRLWAHADTRLEHGLHTARALTVPPMIAALFLPGRASLVAAVALVALDTIFALLDAAVEWKSRRRLGGLPHGEYIAHLVATALHVAAVAVAFVARAMPSPATTSGWSGGIMPIVGALVVATALGAIHHVVLLVKGVDPIRSGQLERPGAGPGPSLGGP
jgi:hypothetical protein